MTLWSSDTAPPQDSRLLHLLSEAGDGRCPLYFAVVPIKYVRVFSASYKPVSWEPWKVAVDLFKDVLSNKKSVPLLVYQEGDFFIVSDDYPAYYAHLETDEEMALCFVLGTPVGTHFHLEREASADDRLKILGF